MGKGVLLGTEVPDPRALGVTLGHVFIPGHVRGGGSIHVGRGGPGEEACLIPLPRQRGGR